MSKVFVTLKAQGKFIIDPQSRQPVGREQRDVSKVFEGTDSLDAVRAWAGSHEAEACTLLFESPEAQP